MTFQEFSEYLGTIPNGEIRLFTVPWNAIYMQFLGSEAIGLCCRYFACLMVREHIAWFKPDTPERGWFEA